MRFRKLRIAFSATCLIACVLLIVLWIQVHRRNQIILTVPIDIPGESPPEFVYALLPGLFLIGTLVSAYPMMRDLHFRLRSLLIATTLVAVVLGLVLYVSK